MFRELRRKDRKLSREDGVALLERGARCHWAGILGVNGDDGYPYTVPVSYAYADNKIIFHCARAGHKLDAILRDPRVSFCVVEKNEKGEESYIIDPSPLDTPVAEQHYKHAYCSVIAFGKARVVEDEEARLAAFSLLNHQRTPDYLARGDLETQRRAKGALIVEIEIEHLSAKGVRNESHETPPVKED